MQINIDKKTGALLTIIAVLVATLAFVTISRNESPMDDMDSHTGHMSSNSTYTGADVMFLQMMIPHHQQAIDMSNLALTRSTNTELLALAKKIATDQAAEIIQMRAWLKVANATEDMGHSMHDMGGMLSTEELANLKAASGNAFDKLWLSGMIGHHDGAIHMTNMIIDAQNSEIKKFGEKIVADQSAQITQMKAMLTKL